VFAAADVEGLPRHEVGVGRSQEKDGADQILAGLVALDGAGLDLRLGCRNVYSRPEESAAPSTGAFAA
jgi:hypothetical protein